MKSHWLITIRRKETKEGNIPEMENTFITFNTKHPNLQKIGLKPHEDVVRMIRIEDPRILLPPVLP